jgi:hypothetical protein
MQEVVVVQRQQDPQLVLEVQGVVEMVLLEIMDLEEPQEHQILVEEVVEAQVALLTQEVMVDLE